jgi:prepilin-type N-terminal cleavage/methylation domain-containing protein
VAAALPGTGVDAFAPTMSPIRPEPCRTADTAAPRPRGVRGFSLVELVIVVALIAIVSAMTVPSILNMMTGMRVSSDARLVERELQTARLRAVATNRAMRLRFNCPTAGQYRLVEVIGTPTVPAPDDDSAAAATRCGTTKYPYPDTNKDWFESPNNDGPLNRLDWRVVFTATQSLEFWPDGTVHADAGAGSPWPQIPANQSVTITLQQALGTTTEKAATERRIQVNGVGKIALQ